MCAARLNRMGAGSGKFSFGDIVRLSRESSATCTRDRPWPAESYPGTSEPSPRANANARLLRHAERGVRVSSFGALTHRRSNINAVTRPDADHDAEKASCDVRARSQSPRKLYPCCPPRCAPSALFTDYVGKRCALDGDLAPVARVLSSAFFLCLGRALLFGNAASQAWLDVRRPYFESRRRLRGVIEVGQCHARQCLSDRTLVSSGDRPLPRRDERERLPVNSARAVRPTRWM